MKDDVPGAGATDLPPISGGGQEPEKPAGPSVPTYPLQPGIPGSLDRFEALSLVGVGGMGLVVLARDPETDSRVAIKLLKTEYAASPRSRHLFLVEARHMQRLDHPHILKVLGVGDRPERPYFVMPFCEQGSVAHLVQPGVGLDRETVLRLVTQVAEALAYAHRRGLIHRDLKPGNILIDAAGHACLADFGLARTVFNDSILDVNASRPEGTPAYMSPAVAGGHAEDTRCDIYSFGAVLYEMLTGCPPYDGSSTEQILKAVRETAPRPIRSVRPDAPPDLTAIAEGAMARELRNRYAQMEDVLADLTRAKDGLPISGPRGSQGRFPRWNTFLGRKAVASRLGVVAAAMMLGTGWWALRPVRFSLSPVETIESPYLPNWSAAKLGDWDGDRRPDLFVAREDRWWVRLHRGELLGPYRLEAANAAPLGLDLVQDLTGDGLDEVFLSWVEGSNSFVSVMNQYPREIKRFHAAGAEHTDSKTGTTFAPLIAQRLADLDGDGRPELLCYVHAERAKNPRGLCCFDGQTQQVRWKHLIAPYPTTLQVIDLRGNGQSGILLGTFAADNNNRLPDGMDDAHSSLDALSGDGRLLWRRELGGRTSDCQPFLARGASGERLLYAWVSSSAEEAIRTGTPEMGRILKLRPDGQTVTTYDAGSRLYGCAAADLDGDGREEIFATDYRGRLHCLDSDLRLLGCLQVTSNSHDGVRLNIASHAKLRPCRAKQLVLTSAQLQNIDISNPGNHRETLNKVMQWEDSIVVLDRKLERVASYLLGTGENAHFARRSVTVTDWDGDGLYEVLVLGNQVTVLKLMEANSTSKQKP